MGLPAIHWSLGSKSIIVPLSGSGKIFGLMIVRSRMNPGALSDHCKQRWLGAGPYGQKSYFSCLESSI